MRICKASAPSAEIFTRHRRALMSRLRQALYRERVLSARMASKYDPARVVLYAYWTSDWATVLGLWKLDDAEVHFSTRMMGFDMYDHRATDGWQVMQAFHIQQVQRVFTIARAGQEHMCSRFPSEAHKFQLSYLATTDHGIGPWAPSLKLRIVSCANLVPLKRVHLLIEALASLELPVQWTHYGDGPERPRIEALVRSLPEHITVDMKWNRPNAEIIAWYKAHAVDVFVHTSETEGGAPVALQEAASFGIPLIAADAGGVREIVTKETGTLLPLDLTAAQLATTLRNFTTSPWYDAETRVHVRNFWQANFHAEEVHGRLLEQLLSV
jgi:glycosyltransferase involved in cell wall biosynthesis